MFSRARFSMLFLLSFLLMVGCSGVSAAQSPAILPIPVQSVPQEAADPSTNSVPAKPPELIIGNGDLLEVSVYGAADFIKQVRVADSGEISLPLIGAVHVAGLTILQAEQLVQGRLSEGGFFNDPQVSILEKEYATQGISVLGEVQKPGIYPLLGSRNLYDAISAAGGVTAKAGNTITVTHRAHLRDAQIITLPPNRTFPPEVNVEILPGDTVVVSKAGIVYVVGDVKMPGGFVMENSQMTVLQAVAMAQGTNSTAKLDKTILIRKTANTPEQTPIPLDRIMSAKVSDVNLRPDDVVFVPRSTAKAASRRGLEAILQTLTGVAIYRPY